MEVLNQKLAEHGQEITRIDEEITALETQIDELKSKYPKLLTPPSAAAKDYLETARNSEWWNDEVEVTGDVNDALILSNLTQREKLAERMTTAKLEAADLAFRLVKMTEKNSTSYERNNTAAIISEKEKAVIEAKEKMNASGSTQVHFALGGYRTDIQTNPSAALIASVAMMKATDVIGKRMSYKELTEQLKSEFKDGLDETTRNLVQKTYQDLTRKRDDLARQKDN